MMISKATGKIYVTTSGSYGELLNTKLSQTQSKVVLVEQCLQKAEAWRPGSCQRKLFNSYSQLFNVFVSQ